MAYMLAKVGWFGGNPSTIYATSIDEVIKAYDFEQMSRDYEKTFINLNKGSQ